MKIHSLHNKAISEGTSLQNFTTVETGNGTYVRSGKEELGIKN